MFYSPIFLKFLSIWTYYSITVAPPTQGTWRSNDYVNALRLVDGFSMEWVVELFIYILGG